MYEKYVKAFKHIQRFTIVSITNEKSTDTR